MSPRRTARPMSTHSLAAALGPASKVACGRLVERRKLPAGQVRSATPSSTHDAGRRSRIHRRSIDSKVARRRAGRDETREREGAEQGAEEHRDGVESRESQCQVTRIAVQGKKLVRDSQRKARRLLLILDLGAAVQGSEGGRSDRSLERDPGPEPNIASGADGAARARDTASE